MQPIVGSQQQFCLRWNNYQSNLTNVFDQLLQSGSFVDVTLACGGHSIKAHKMVLSACSPYFQSLFFENPCQHPIVFMKDIKWPQLKAVVEFMYKGEINVSQEQIGPLLKVAESLKIRGLADVNGEQDIASELSTNPSQIKTESPVSNAQNNSGNTDNGDDTPDTGSRPKKRRRTSGDRIGASNVSGELVEATTPKGDISSVSTAVLAPKQPSDTIEPQPLTLTVPQPPPASQTAPSDVDIKMKFEYSDLRDDERSKLMDSSHGWLGTTSSSSSISDYPSMLKLKTPTWTQDQLKEAIDAVVNQRMRFTQAAARYGIPKGTLYDNILGKSKRMAVLEEAGLTSLEEASVLEFCCEVSLSPYNRRTKKSLASVLEYVEKLRRNRDPQFMFTGLSGFRWWWAFCKKHSIVSLHYENNGLVNS